MFFTLFAQPVLAFNLDIWGVGHVSVDQADDGQRDATHVASNSSRLGFSGDHDLGNGISVIYRYESGVDLTGQGGNDGNGGPLNPQGSVFTSTRDSYVGVTGGFGTLQFGKNGGVNEWVYDYNLFADQVGDLGNFWGGTGLPGRVTDQARYTTPDIGGFNASVSYSPEEGSDDTENLLLKANFGMEGLKLGVAYMSQGQGVDPVTLKERDEHTAVAITGSYSFGNFTIGGGWQDESDIGGTKKNDRDGFTVGASAALGDATVKAQFVSTSGDLFKETDATQIAVGVDYSLGENTTIYIAYAKTDNDDFFVAGSPVPGGFSANNYGKGDNVGAARDLSGRMGDPDVISIGLVYKFNARLWPR